MRITTNMIYDRNLYSLTNTNERLNKAYQQLQTGNKFQTAGEDPAGMSQKMALTKEIDLFKQYGVNGSLLENSLGHEETVLASINTAMQSAQTLIQKSNNGAISLDDRKAIASELEGLQQQIFDLMNSKNSSGEFIFGGNQSKTQPYIKDANGKYIYQGDPGQRHIQVSPTVQIAANDSGQDLFEIVATRRTASAASADIQVRIGDQGNFDNFYKSNYNSALPSNTYTVSTTIGPPDTYDIKDGGGNTLQTGNYTAGTKIPFNGLELTVSSSVGNTEQFNLNPPKNDNILNGMSEFITALRDPNISAESFERKVADTSVHMNNARLNIDHGLGELGGRMNSLEQVINSNEGLSILNTEARAKVADMDLYEVISTLAKEDAALSASQLSFSKISRLTLFDYIR